MDCIDMEEAKIHLSRLVDRAAMGEPFIIAKAGKPLVKVVAVEPPLRDAGKRLGFMAGEIEVPAGFDRMGGSGIERLFGAAD